MQMPDDTAINGKKNQFILTKNVELKLKTKQKTKISVFWRACTFTIWRVSEH